MDLEGERRSAKREFYLIAGFAFVLTIVIVIGAIIFINSGVIHREKARNYPVEEIFDPNVCRLKVCGGSDPKRTSPSAKIIEGDETPLGLLPFQAVFWDDSGLFCGGSMLNDRWIVSSAHCFVRRKRKFSSLRVAVGIIDADDSINYVEPICLPYSGVDTEGDDFKTGIISGFGSTQDGSNRMSQTLRNASVKLFDHEKCSEIIEKYATFDSNLMICAGNEEAHQDACTGDSGGPLFYKNSQGKFVLKGLVDSGHKCGEPGVGALYTNVAKYLDWMCRKMYKNGLT